MCEYCKTYLPDFPLTRLEGTYLVWMDCTHTHLTSAELDKRLKSEAGLWLNQGDMYGLEGEGFMRWNIACPRSVLTKGLDRFRQFVEKSVF